MARGDANPSDSGIPSTTFTYVPQLGFSCNHDPISPHELWGAILYIRHKYKSSWSDNSPLFFIFERIEQPLFVVGFFYRPPKYPGVVPTIPSLSCSSRSHIHRICNFEKFKFRTRLTSLVRMVSTEIKKHANNDALPEFF